MDLRAFLKGKKDEWADQAARSKENRSFQNIPDGGYTFQLGEVKLAESNAGTPQVLWKWVVNDGGEYHGQMCWDRDNLDREDAFYWLWIKLAKFGYDPDDYPDPTKLPNLLEEMTTSAPTIKGKLKTKGEWQNLHIDAVLDDDGDERTSSADDDDEEEVDLEVGTAVSFMLKGKEVTGEVTAIDEDEETATVKVGTKSHTVAFDDLTVLDDPFAEDAEPVKPAPKAAPAKAAPAKAAPAKGKVAPEPEPEDEDEDDDEDDDDSDEDDDEDDDEGEGAIPEVGDLVTFELGGKTLEGAVTAVDEDEETATVKVGRKSHTVAFSDLTLPEPEAELEVGAKVEFELNGKTLSGVVTAIDEGANTASVKVLKKTHTVSIDEIVILDDETDD